MRVNFVLALLLRVISESVRGGWYFGVFKSPLRERERDVDTQIKIHSDKDTFR